MQLAKTKVCRFGEGVISWIKSYLQDRQQITKFGSETSQYLFKFRGVPQSRCLGPILFNLYTSGFPLLNGESLVVCHRVKTRGDVLGRGLTSSDHISHVTHRSIGRLNGFVQIHNMLLPETAKLRLMQTLVLLSRDDVGRIQKLRRIDSIPPYWDSVKFSKFENQSISARNSCIGGRSLNEAPAKMEGFITES
ncbi:hypothetical protein J6590_019580 [Homalodisca vitripennis]|nr:hypothetical protein J6590_019580 [Homalodisca vitripennis]